MDSTYRPSQAIPAIDFATLDLLPYGIIVVDEAGTILFYNEREEQIAGRSRDKVLGKNFFSEVAPCTQVQDFYGRFQDVIYQRELSVRFGFVFPFPGNPREVSITLTTFQHNDQRLCMISVQDITSEQSLRQQLQQNEVLRDIGEVAIAAAHNFNNILTAINGYAQLIERSPDNTQRVLRYVNQILRATNDGMTIVRRIRDDVHDEMVATQQRERTDLNTIVADALDLALSYLQQAREKRAATIELDWQPHPLPVMVNVNAAEIREVMLNLTQNAVDAIGGEGTISIKVGRDTNWATITVSDTGSGIPENIQHKMFRPFFTTKGNNGTGLGLSSSYSIVTRYEGQIAFTSQPGVGTTFSVQLPIARHQDAKEAP